MSKSIGTFQITGGTVSGSGMLTSSAAYDIQAGRSTPSSLATSIALNKTGAGTAVLTGANSYTGLTTVAWRYTRIGTGGAERRAQPRRREHQAQTSAGERSRSQNWSSTTLAQRPGGDDPCLVDASYDGGDWDVGKFLRIRPRRPSD